jgi:subtilisin family serine protease
VRVGVWSTTAFNTYSSYNGTSMATPHVTGAAALYASTHPGSTAAQIKEAILSSVVPTTSLSAKTLTGGRLNVSGF